MFEKCLFSYYMSEEKVTVLGLSVSNNFGKYTIITDANTPFLKASDNTNECAIYGFAVDVISPSIDSIAEQILKKCKDIQDVIVYEKHLGGKYIIFYKSGDSYYVIGDATCSIPIFYSTEGDFACSNNYAYIFNYKQYLIDDEFLCIRKNSDISQAMPYDITPCREIKQLIPNHYLCVNRSKSVRFVNSSCKQAEISIEEATDIVLPMIQNLLSFYQSKFKIYCPITSGRDSRVVLSFLLKNQVNFSCYTIKHPEHNNKTQDIVIPIEICQKESVEHKLVEDVDISEELINYVDGLLGNQNYSLRTLRIGQTIKEYFGDGAIINGDIIGQVGKCSLHRDIPAVFATPSYFCCKLHNYSKNSKSQMKQWLDGIKSSGEKVNVFDLFSIENRMGRWAGQVNLVYNTIGQMSINIFNSRSIIYTWTAVARNKRKKALIHSDLIKKTHPSLLDILFERDDSIISNIAKATGITYLLASYAKFYIEKMKFRKSKK